MKYAYLSLALILGMCGAAQAGLYNPCEIDDGPFVPNFLTITEKRGKQTVEIRGFQEIYLKYSTLGLPEDKINGLFQRRYLLVGERLTASADKLSLADKISLSEYMMRRGRSLDAKLLLLPLTRKGEKNFLMLGNLATACILQAETKQGGERSREYQEAADYLSEAIKQWPAPYIGGIEDEPLKKLLESMNWSEETILRCRTAEEYLLKLVRSRQREKGPYETVDPLFGPVQYVGESGSFEVGKLAKAEQAKFPEGKIDQALAIVQQLLIWLPRDNRLYWQLGELHNARGTPSDLRAAQKIFQELVYDRGLTHIKDLKNRRVELNNFTIPEQSSEGPSDIEKKLNADDDVPVVNWRTLGVGFGSGLVVALFAQWQIQEIRRRRQVRAQ